MNNFEFKIEQPVFEFAQNKPNFEILMPNVIVYQSQYLNLLKDVEIDNPLDKQALMFDSIKQKWLNKTIITTETDPKFSAWLSLTPPAYPGDIPTALSDLSDDTTHRLVTDTEKSARSSKQDDLGFTPENVINRNANNGYCPLDSGGKVPLQNLPSSLLKYIGVWNANTNNPALTANDITKKGYVYNVGTPGVQFGITWSLGDWAIYNDNGDIEKSDNSDDVVSVNGQTGTVVLNADHISDLLTTNKFVTDTQKTNRNTAYGRGNHSSAGYFKTNQTVPQTITGGVPFFSAGIKAIKRTSGPVSAVEYTPAGDDFDCYDINSTEVAGTMTFNAPTGTPTNFQKLEILVRATNAQTFLWNTMYRSTTEVVLPTAIGAGKVILLGFEYHTYSGKRDAIALTNIV